MFGHYAERVSVEIRRFLSSPVTGFCFDSGLCFTALTVVEVNDIKEWLSAVCVCASVCVCVCVCYLSVSDIRMPVDPLWWRQFFYSYCFVRVLS